MGEPAFVNERKGEYVFICPKVGCNKRKPKLSVNIDHDVFNCWSCGFKGKSLAGIIRLGKDISLLKEYLDQFATESDSVGREQDLKPELPPEYVSFFAGGFDNRYFRYLERRGLSQHDCIKYKLGYVQNGKFHDRIIIPSFDKIGQLNFFSARTIFPDEKYRYMTPPTSKDVVFFESMVDWSAPIVLVEGALDAIRTGEEAVPLHGKFLSQQLLQTIVMNGNQVTIALDSDAKATSAKIAKKLLRFGVDVRLSYLPEGKDPADLGPLGMKDVCMQSKSVEDDVFFAVMGSI